jgi:hypothetical protein
MNGMRLGQELIVTTSGTGKSMSQYYEYLNALRESGKVNMFGAAPYLQDTFGLDRKEARKILVEWMDSFKR